MELGALPQPGTQPSGPSQVQRGQHSVCPTVGCAQSESQRDDHFLLLTMLNEWTKSGKLQEQKLPLKNTFTNKLSPAWLLDRLVYMMSHREDICMIKPIPGLIYNWCHFRSQDV